MQMQGTYYVGDDEGLRADCPTLLLRKCLMLLHVIQPRTLHSLEGTTNLYQYHLRVYQRSGSPTGTGS